MTRPWLWGVGLGLCVGCKVFYVGMRLGLVPASVCEQCANVLAANRA